MPNGGMTMDKVFCPYCGKEMTLNGLGKRRWFFCASCNASAADAATEAEAYNLAVSRPLQKPLTLAEACESEEPCVYFEFGRSGFAPIKAALITKKQDENGYEAVILGVAKPIPFYANMYGSVLRCWATKPTDEEREAAKWHL